MKWLKSRLSMRLVETLFWDKVNGKAVHLYIDCFGEYYMAQSKFGFRVKQLKQDT